MSAVFGFCLSGPMMVILIMRMMVATKMIMVVMMVIVISIVRRQGSENLICTFFVISVVQFCSYFTLLCNLQDICEKPTKTPGWDLEGGDGLPSFPPRGLGPASSKSDFLFEVLLH